MDDLKPAMRKWTFSSQIGRSFASKTLKYHFDVTLNEKTIRYFSFDIRPPQDVDVLTVLDFENPCFRPEILYTHVRRLLTDVQDDVLWSPVRFSRRAWVNFSQIERFKKQNRTVLRETLERLKTKMDVLKV